MGTRKAAKGDGHMKRNKKNEVFFLPLLGLLWILLLPGLGNEQGENGQIPSGGVGQQPDEEQGQQEVESMPQAILSVGGQEFTIVLEDNEAARALVERFPLSLEMADLHGNEKYTYLEQPLPTASYQPGQIKAGDFMLFGDDCLVVFYESFSSGYSYTRLGAIEDPAGLARALGEGPVSVQLTLNIDE